MLRRALSSRFLLAAYHSQNHGIRRSADAHFRCWGTSVQLQHGCGYSVGNFAQQLQQKLSRSCVSQHSWYTFHQASCLQKNLSGGKKSDVHKGTPKPPNASKIEVIGADGKSLGQMDHSKASRLAIDNDLKLVLMQPANESSPVAQYQLMTSKAYKDNLTRLRDAERMEKVKQQSTKMIKMKSSIGEHDLQIKVSHIVELLQKGHNVKVEISQRANATNQEKIFDDVIAVTKDLAVVKQARRTESLMTFELRPKSAPVTDSNKNTTAESDALRPLKIDELKKPKTADTETSN